jgi:hypothetical protein
MASSHERAKRTKKLLPPLSDHWSQWVTHCHCNTMFHGIMIVKVNWDHRDVANSDLLRDTLSHSVIYRFWSITVSHNIEEN